MEHKIFQISNIHFYFKIFFENGKLYKLTFSDNKNDLIDPQLSLKINEGRPSQFAKEVQIQLDKYFKRKLKFFDIPLNIEGSEFTKNVLKEIGKIPYGETKSYKEVAEKIVFPLLFLVTG
jgi:methylated-DNA-[protein]-cysteine S-methyltransferase